MRSLWPVLIIYPITSKTDCTGHGQCFNHKSFEFQENIERWQQQGLTIDNIAPYSPELNIIEIVWRKIKYEWMPFCL